MPRPHDLCSAIQNASRARHQRVAVPHSTQNLGILSTLLRAGFISNLTRGTVDTPSPEAFHETDDSNRRIWADLKFRSDRPVLETMRLVSMPSKRIFMDSVEIRRICSGRSAQTVKPLGMGEIAVVHTNDKQNEWVEAREAVKLRLDGEVICRAR
ncbi:ribosomal protein S8 [Amylostereum chailletii]|nr:ribosomal protein S8 [Amylostereum chailletii]